MTVITKDKCDAEVLHVGKLAVLDFWAAWWGPCMMLKPVFEELSQEMPQVKFCKLDVDEERELAMQYGIESIPTLLFFKDGRVIHKLVGLRGKDELRAEIEARA